MADNDFDYAFEPESICLVCGQEPAGCTCDIYDHAEETQREPELTTAELGVIAYKLESLQTELATTKQLLMQFSLSLSIPVKDLAERGVERVIGMRKALETIEGISSASTTANSLPNIARLARLALGQAGEAGEEG